MTDRYHAGGLLAFVLDDAGTDVIPCSVLGIGATPFGSHPRALMPFLSALASQGTTYTRFYTQAACSSTRATLLTGQTPAVHRIGSVFNVDSAPGSKLDPQLAWPNRQDISEPPIVCYHVGKWHLAAHDVDWQQHAEDCGFEHVFGEAGNLGTHWQDGMHSTQRTTEQAIVALDRAELYVHEPFYIQVHFHAPHSPYETATDIPEDYLPDLPQEHRAYLWMLHEADQAMSTIWGSMPGYMRERTRVAILSDNGTPAEFNYWGDGRAKGTMHEGGIRGWMTVYDPQDGAQIRRHKDPVSCTTWPEVAEELSQGRAFIPPTSGWIATVRQKPVATADDSSVDVLDQCVTAEHEKYIRACRRRANGKVVTTLEAYSLSGAYLEIETPVLLDPLEEQQAHDLLDMHCGPVLEENG